ncbi:MULTISPECIES: helix-turn-helix domain-containing protein [Bradyrhizobium]|uniref:helix-turn-helix domain-containing protein n=1 Tax=Bradyrhizobium TaxID=374 RepID=UPI00361D20CE
MIGKANKPIAVSQEAAADLLGIDRRKIAQAVKSRELISHQNGAAVRLLVSDIEQWVRSWPEPQSRRARARKDEPRCP